MTTPDPRGRAIKALRKARKGSLDLPTGTVIRWTSADRYTYAAIRTGIGWFTTSRAGNTFVPQVVTFVELLDIIARPETTEVAVATEWESVEPNPLER